MGDIRQSPSSENKVAFDAESVAGDLWMRQHYHEIHLELETQDANDFLQTAQAAGLVLDSSQTTSLETDADLAH